MTKMVQVPISASSGLRACNACAAGVYARTAFKGLARALGTMVRLDCLAAQNAHIPHAFAMFKRYAKPYAASDLMSCIRMTSLEVEDEDTQATYKNGRNLRCCPLLPESCCRAPLVLECWCGFLSSFACLIDPRSSVSAGHSNVPTQSSPL